MTELLKINYSYLIPEVGIENNGLKLWRVTSGAQRVWRAPEGQVDKKCLTSKK